MHDIKLLLQGIAKEYNTFTHQITHVPFGSWHTDCCMNCCVSIVFLGVLIVGFFVLAFILL